MAALKKGSKAAKDFMAKIRAAKGKTKPKKVGATKILVKKKQSGGSNRKYDKLVQALPAGKRKTGKTHYANGKKITHLTTYTETRKNRSDKGKLLGVPIFEYKVSYGGKYYVNTNIPLFGVGIIKTGNGNDHKRGLFTYLFTPLALKKIQKMLGKENTTYIESDY